MAGLYDATIRRHPVWTVEEERAVGRRLVTARKELRTAERRKDDGAARLATRELSDIKEEYVRHNLKLVIAQAVKASRIGLMSTEDATQRGLIGMLRAVEKYEPEQGFRFCTYALWWVRQAITRGTQEEAVVRRPVYIEDMDRRVRRVIAQAKTKRGEDDIVTVEEIAEHLGVSVGKAGAALRRVKVRVASVDAPVSDDGDVTLGECLSDGDPDIEGAIYTASREQAARDLLATLGDARSVAILTSRFFDGLTLEAVGEQHGITRERVRQIEAKALRRLGRRALWHRVLRDDAERLAERRKAMGEEDDADGA